MFARREFKYELIEVRRNVRFKLENEAVIFILFYLNPNQITSFQRLQQVSFGTETGMGLCYPHEDQNQIVSAIQSFLGLTKSHWFECKQKLFNSEHYQTFVI